jgi:hypothetical protein
MGKPSMQVPDVPEDWKDTAPAEREVGEYYLPGLGPTYLHPEFGDKVADFIQKAKGQSVTLRFSEGHRDQPAQDAVRRNPNSITPAQNSLHSAGRGVDIHDWDKMGGTSQGVVLNAAKDAGLSWGGDFRTPDRPHFYSDPGTDRRQLIDKFSRAVAAFRGQIPDR